MTAGLLNLSGLNQASQHASIGQRLMQHTGRASLQGAIQAVMGGKFRDGFVNSMMSSVAGEVSAALNQNIDQLQSLGCLNQAEASSMRLLARAAGSALRLVGSDDPSASFASDFLGGLLGDAMQGQAGQGPTADPDATHQAHDAVPNGRPGIAADPAAPRQIIVAPGDTLERIARQHYGEHWRAGLPLLLADNQLSANRWGSPIIRPGQHLQARPLQGFSPEQLGELSRLGGQIISQNAHGLNVREQIEAMRREQAARQNLGRHPQGQQPQQQTQGRNPQGQRPQQQAQGQHAQEQTPQGQAGPGQAQSSWGQLANAEAQRWNALIDRLDEAAIADGGGPITIAAAAARAPARAFLTLLRDAVGTASLGDPMVRAQLLDQLGHLVKNPGVVLDAVTHYWSTHSAGEIAGDAFANGAAGLMGAGVAGRMVNGVRGVAGRGGRDVPGLSPISGASGPGSPYPAGVNAVRGPASGRTYDPDQAGGPVRHLSTDGVRITDRGIDVVLAHVSRLDPHPANDYMIDRLRRIARGELQATQYDLNYYTHELREYVRYRRMEYGSTLPNDPLGRHVLWNNTHTATLEDYGIPDTHLYHPGAPNAD